MKIADLTERAIGQAARWIWGLVTAGLGIASTDQANVEQISAPFGKICGIGIVYTDGDLLSERVVWTSLSLIIFNIRNQKFQIITKRDLCRFV